MTTPEVTQEFLDSSQYTDSSIVKYESVFGEDFVSPGGREMAYELIDRLGLGAGCRVLDVGCGLGGSAFLMARDFDLKVDGIDLSTNMLQMAREKLVGHGLQDWIKFEHGDCLELDRPARYDGIYSRDVFLHIHDKERLFRVLKEVLKPGGKLLFTDYCCGEKPWTDDFSAYVQDRGYCLHTLPEYAELIADAGFDDVVYEDFSNRFIDILHNDISNIKTLDMDRATKEKLEASWQEKLERAEIGNHRWGLFTAIRLI